MTNEEQVRRNERYLRQTEARDYEEFAGLCEEEEPDFEEPEEEKRRAPKGTASHHKENSMFSQKMQQERTWQTASAEIITHIVRLYNVDIEYARRLYRDALDTTSAWTAIMQLVAHDVEWDKARAEEAEAIKERLRKEAEEAAREDAHYARLRGE